MNEQYATPEAKQCVRRPLRLGLPRFLRSGGFWFLFLTVFPFLAAIIVGGYDFNFPVAHRTVSGVVMFDQGMPQNTNNKHRILVLTSYGTEICDYIKDGHPPKKNDRVALTYYYGPISGSLRRVVATAVNDPEAASK